MDWKDKWDAMIWYYLKTVPDSLDDEQWMEACRVLEFIKKEKLIGG
ncbi:MAG: hypothetical protein NW226_17505 [Microscillaceae bacterium]|nr:hypothetical protein [Microscillaceae bacterium]